MIYITGDTHRGFKRIEEFCYQAQTTKKDKLIILGDVGINYDGGEEDRQLKQKLRKLPLTLFCIHGNHEQRPQCIPGYTETVWHGGTIFTQSEYPNLLFAKDGEIFDLNGRKCIVIGGAYSVDKFIRLENGARWWDNEQPSDEIKAHVEKTLDEANWMVDAVLSHTCPLRYEPHEAFLQSIVQATVDSSTEQWLGSIEQRLKYDKWYCGHYHVSKAIDKMVFMFKDFRAFSLDR
jgi:3-oxoacid CoA-transferase subunit A